VAAPLEDISALADAELKILGLANTRLQDLAPLAGQALESIYLGGNLELSSLAGLEGFTGGPEAIFDLSGSPNLRNLGGMGNVAQLGQLLLWDTHLETLEGLGGPDGTEISLRLQVINNPKLKTLTRLRASATEPGLSVDIVDNDVLGSLAGLEGVTRFSHLSLERNGALASLAALAQSDCTSGGTLRIEDNARLTTLTGLERWAGVGSMSILRNASLTSLAGLHGTVGTGSLAVEQVLVADNPKLTTLAGLDLVAARPDDRITLTFTDNPALPQCEVDAVIAPIASQSEVTLSGNDE
jgi:hypothetical protein